MNEHTQAGTINPYMDQTSSDTRLEGNWLRLARISWVVLAVISVAILITSLPGYGQLIQNGIPGHGVVENPTTGFMVLQIFNSTASLASSILSLTLALILFRNKFENPAIAAVSIYLLLYGTIMTGPIEAWNSYWFGNIDIAMQLQTLLMNVPTVALLLLFPNGKFSPGWMRWVLIVAVPWNIIAILMPVFPFGDPSILIFSSLMWALFLGFSIYSQIFRYRYVSTPNERQQTKWVLFGFIIWLGYLLISSVPYFYLTTMPAGTIRPWWASLSEISWWLSLMIVPVSLAIAITRSRLWNIDIVINRTLVYGALTIATMTIYIFVVGTLGNLLQIGNSTFIAFLTTGLVAILFQPIRDRLQRWVNNIMYGERDDPVAVLSKLGEELEHTGSPEDALSGITETVAQTLKLPYVAIELGASNDVAASYGIPKSELIRLPMLYQAETSGYLVVAHRSPGESFNASERQLLVNIAHQAGAVAHSAKLTADLRISRQRLVSAREEERRRIRRDLHDGLGPQLASQTLTLTAARRMLEQDPQAADNLLKEAIKHAQAATDDVRRVIYDLRPPALDDLGLIGAIKSLTQRLETGGMSINIHTPEQLPTLPAAAEVACYFIIQEALNNIIRHSGAKTCTITLEINRHLHIEILDQGRGIPPDIRHGVGLVSMRQRTEELDGNFQIELPTNGGTKLIVDLPLSVDKE